MKDLWKVQRIYLPTLLSWCALILMVLLFTQTMLWYLSKTAQWSTFTKAFIFSLVPYLLFFTSTFSLMIYLPRSNFAWLVQLPCSRKATVVHLALLRFCCFLLPLVTIALFQIFFMLAIKHWSLVTAWHKLESRLYLPNVTASELLIGFATLNIILYPMLGYIDPKGTLVRQLMGRLIHFRKARNLAPLSLLAFLTAMFFYQTHLTLFLCAAALFFDIPFAWRDELVVSRRTFRHSLAGVVAVVGMETLIFLGSCVGMLHGSLADQLAVRELLPRAIAPMSTREIASFLERDLNQDQAENLTSEYLRQRGGVKVDAQHEKETNFQNIIHSKHDYRALIASLSIYEPKTLHLVQVKAVLDRAARVRENWGVFSTARHLYHAQLSHSDIKKLLASASENEVSFGLILARRVRSAEYAEIIARRLPLWPAGLAKQGLDTLSIIAGDRFSISDWYKYVHGENHYAMGTYFSCDTEAKNTALINLCLRSKFPEMNVELEKVGWIDNPYSPENQRWLSALKD